MSRMFVKDPEAILDYSFDWEQWLDGDTLSTSTWAADSGITIDSSSRTSTVSTVWLSGGTNKLDYEITNTITTATGRTDERTFTIKVRNR